MDKKVKSYFYKLLNLFRFIYLFLREVFSKFKNWLLILSLLLSILTLINTIKNKSHFEHVVIYGKEYDFLNTISSYCINISSSIILFYFLEWSFRKVIEGRPKKLSFNDFHEDNIKKIQKLKGKNEIKILTTFINVFDDEKSVSVKKKIQKKILLKPYLELVIFTSSKKNLQIKHKHNL